jgi:hypothetical protein
MWNGWSRKVLTDWWSYYDPVQAVSGTTASWTFAGVVRLAHVR